MGFDRPSCRICGRAFGQLNRGNRNVNEDIMAQTSAWHGEKSIVHHNNTSCTEGNNVENRKEGTGGLTLCSPCKTLNDKK